MKRRNLLKLGLAGGITALIIAVISHQKIRRIGFARSMFSGAEQVEAFRSLDHFFPTRKIARSDQPSTLQDGPPITLPNTYSYKTGTRDLSKFLEDTDTTGLLILKNDEIVFEEHYLGNNPSSRTIAWSVTKSFVSALVGIAINEGYIQQVEDTTWKVMSREK